MPRYVDGYLLAIPKNKLPEYRRIARKCGKVWKEHGALEYVECVAEDVKPGKLTSFPQAVKRKRGETVVFAYVVYRSRAHRDRVNKRAMEDPRLAAFTKPGGVPFHTKRLVWGGFKDLVRL
jgi:uncharacterized protein YbaA (DUF1428 family)